MIYSISVVRTTAWISSKGVCSPKKLDVPSVTHFLTQISYRVIRWPGIISSSKPTPLASISAGSDGNYGIYIYR